LRGVLAIVEHLQISPKAQINSFSLSSFKFTQIIDFSETLAL